MQGITIVKCTFNYQNNLISCFTCRYQRLNMRMSINISGMSLEVHQGIQSLPFAQ